MDTKRVHNIQLDFFNYFPTVFGVYMYHVRISITIVCSYIEEYI